MIASGVHMAGNFAHFHFHDFPQNCPKIVPKNCPKPPSKNGGRFPSHDFRGEQPRSRALGIFHWTRTCSSDRGEVIIYRAVVFLFVVNPTVSMAVSTYRTYLKLLYMIIRIIHTIHIKSPFLFWLYHLISPCEA